jgi:tRNA pseudouridine55 synthase
LIDMPGAERRAAEGLLLIDKPPGPTSHDIVQVVRRALGVSRVGHAGTLDPFASGLLVIAVGRATRLLRFLTAGDKAYEGEIRLGFATDTDDRTGAPLHETRPVDVAHARLDEILHALSGEFDQIPPIYSARKNQGVPLYRLARQGRAVERAATRVRVRWIATALPAPDLVRFRVIVSAGTYVRALARDIGEALGCGAHLESLRRTASGSFTVEEALAFPPQAADLLASIRPIDSIPLGIPTIELGPEACRSLCTGRTAEEPPGRPGEAAPWIRVVDLEGRLVAIAEGEGAPGSRILLPRVVLQGLGSQR